jgi:hypothetical protein
VVKWKLEKISSQPESENSVSLHSWGFTSNFTLASEMATAPGLSMKRDIELMRDLLLCIEAADGFDGARQIQPVVGMLTVRKDNYSQAAYLLTQLVEAGFIDRNKSTMPMPTISRLTWHGHEFLDIIRDPDVWAQLKARMVTVSSVSIELLGKLAQAEVGARLGLVHE